MGEKNKAIKDFMDRYEKRADEEKRQNFIDLNKRFICTRHWPEEKQIGIFECMHCEYEARKRVDSWWKPYELLRTKY